MDDYSHDQQKVSYGRKFAFNLSGVKAMLLNGRWYMLVCYRGSATLHMGLFILVCSVCSRAKYYASLVCLRHAERAYYFYSEFYN